MAFISAPRGGFLGSLASLEEASDCARQSSWASFVFVFVSLPGWVGVCARARRVRVGRIESNQVRRWLEIYLAPLLFSLISKRVHLCVCELDCFKPAASLQRPSGPEAAAGGGRPSIVHLRAHLLV